MDDPKSFHFRIENIAPILSVKNMARSVAFYVDILGFQNAPWGDEIFTMVSRDNTGIYLSNDAQGSSGTWVWLGFDGDIHALHQKLKAANVPIKLPPTNFYWAYEMQILDPDGHVLRLGTDPNQQEPFAKPQPSQF